MKLKNATIIAAAALCVSAALNVNAEVIQIFTFSVTTYSQGTNFDNGTDSITAAPKVKTHNTAEILSALAQDKLAQGTWPSNSFPSGSVLGSGDGGLAVYHGTNILVDVSDIMSFSNGDNEITSGKQNDATQLADPATKRLQLGRLTFDDTGIVDGVNLKFFLQGLVTSIKTDTKPVAGVYTETRIGRLSSGTGEGVDSSGTPFVCTGTISATGHAKRSFP